MEEYDVITEKVEVNMNDFVWVRLTHVGEKLLREQYENDPCLRSITSLQDFMESKKEGDWFKFQLWNLMYIFGPTCNGPKLHGMPFQDNLISFTPPTA